MIPQFNEFKGTVQLISGKSIGKDVKIQGIYVAES